VPEALLHLQRRRQSVARSIVQMQFKFKQF
jgi:hypothetical protein